jgi:hypothetical protein
MSLALKFASLLLAFAACLAPRVRAEPQDPRRAPLLEQMRGLASETEITIPDARLQPQLAKDPVFRYDDQPRRIIDATMWVWTLAGRPVAFQKIEAMHHAGTDAPQWCRCLASVSPELLTVEWPGGPPFRATEPGEAFRPVPGAPPVAAATAGRKRQARELARGFTSSLFLDSDHKSSDELRLLTTPILEYADPQTKEFQGAVFGLATNGTNTGLLVLIEARGEGDRLTWHYSPARLTACGVTLSYQDKQVWEAPFWSEASFTNWRFFFARRDPPEEPARE